MDESFNEVPAYGVPMSAKHVMTALGVTFGILFLLYVVSYDLFQESFPIVFLITFIVSLCVSNRKDAPENANIRVSANEIIIPGILVNRPLDMIVERAMIESVWIGYIKGKYGHKSNTSINIVRKYDKPISLSIVVLDPKALAGAIEAKMGIEATEGSGSINKTILWSMIGFLIGGVIVLFYTVRNS